jgi:hypothetical protein
VNLRVEPDKRDSEEECKQREETQIHVVELLNENRRSRMPPEHKIRSCDPKAKLLAGHLPVHPRVNGYLFFWRSRKKIRPSEPGTVFRSGLSKARGETINCHSTW